MKIAEIKAKSVDQLKEELIGLKKEQFNLRFQSAAGEMESPSRFKQIRRTIARIKTVMNEKKGA